MEILEPNLENRIALLDSLRREVIGPDPCGSAAVPAKRALLSHAEFRIPRLQQDGQEVLWQSSPAKRFGTAVLFPVATKISAIPQMDESEIEPGAEPDENRAEEIEKIASRFGSDDDAGDYDVGLANSFRPSAVGLSFVLDIATCTTLQILIENNGRRDRCVVTRSPSGVYSRHPVLVNNRERPLWLRRPVLDAGGNHPSLTLKCDDLPKPGSFNIFPLKGMLLGLEISIVVRPCPGQVSTSILLTVTLINRRAASDPVDEVCLFQAGVTVRASGEQPSILPYPENAGISSINTDPMDESRINDLLYRRERTFAIGHGSSADWEHGRPERTDAVWTDFMPVFETPTVSADLEIRRPDGSKEPLEVSMRKLAGIVRGSDGMAELERLDGAYGAWIDLRYSELNDRTADERATAEKLLERCRNCRQRIRSGMNLVKSNPVVAKAFRLANLAMLMAQLSSSTKLREPSNVHFSVSWEPQYQPVEPATGDPKKGFWRPFQIAFLLMSIKGIVEEQGDEQEVVDLIWFPTGGGKTEAYLGLTAFTVFLGAIRGDPSAGCTVLMRYTLRLLTAQQFQRAATLFCAMEILRKENPELGTRPFTIGLWVGGTTTPNKRRDAVAKLKALSKDTSADNPFILLRCPWCGAKFGPAGLAGKRPWDVFGYVEASTRHGKTVGFRCGDPKCPFGGSPLTKQGAANLPICVIDEDLYAEPPSLLIGTVDKFAMMAWNPAIRSLFGIDEEGKHSGPPPRLIIQDELHMISGPLGSMVGAYELAIEALCTVGSFRPKIVASTATISRAAEQVRALYGRSDMHLFPPAGLDAADSFFARESVDTDGTPLTGRLYAGIMAPGHGSLQTTQVRAFAIMLQFAADLRASPEMADPWWTLLAFYNSIRELGGAATLLASDVPEQLDVLQSRRGQSKSKRRLIHVEELTSRIANDEVPVVLARLDRGIVAVDPVTRRASPDDVIDVCLASNIIEVGVDIPRLALMAIVGQPKTTSQYIQVTSRVGRRSDRPGLVAVLYSQTKPRDRSHFERFRSYHQKLYAQVEPTSVTPFSPPAVERTLHGVLAALVRQRGRMTMEAATPDPFPLSKENELRTWIESVFAKRIASVSGGDTQLAMHVMSRLERRLLEWAAWNPGEWGDFGKQSEDAPLLYPAGATRLPAWGNRGWPTMSSMRNVDATCEASVTGTFNELKDEAHDS